MKINPVCSLFFSTKNGPYIFFWRPWGECVCGVGGHGDNYFALFVALHEYIMTCPGVGVRSFETRIKKPIIGNLIIKLFCTFCVFTFFFHQSVFKIRVWECRHLFTAYLQLLPLYTWEPPLLVAPGMNRARWPLFRSTLCILAPQHRIFHINRFFTFTFYFLPERIQGNKSFLLLFLFFSFVNINGFCLKGHCRVEWENNDNLIMC